MPGFYSHGSADATPLSGEQLRFGNLLEHYQQLYESCMYHLGQLPPDAQLGVAAHSLRAVSADDLSTLAKEYADHPLHIHIAEQTKEVEEITAVYGLKPVEWLLQNQDVSPRWCLIHATNMTDSETRALAQTGATVGLCPITEANLADGVFNGPLFIGACGTYGIGSDSNINISLSKELRTLE